MKLPNILFTLTQIHKNPRVNITRLSRICKVNYATTHKDIKKLKDESLIISVRKGVNHTFILTPKGKKVAIASNSLIGELQK